MFSEDAFQRFSSFFEAHATSTIVLMENAFDEGPSALSEFLSLSLMMAAVLHLKRPVDPVTLRMLVRRHLEEILEELDNAD